MDSARLTDPECAAAFKFGLESSNRPELAYDTRASVRGLVVPRPRLGLCCRLLVRWIIPHSRYDLARCRDRPRRGWLVCRLRAAGLSHVAVTASYLHALVLSRPLATPSSKGGQVAIQTSFTASTALVFGASVCANRMVAPHSAPTWLPSSAHSLVRHERLPLSLHRRLDRGRLASSSAPACRVRRSRCQRCRQSSPVQSALLRLRRCPPPVARAAQPPQPAPRRAARPAGHTAGGSHTPLRQPARQR